MFDISLRWQDGFIQCLGYAVVVVAILWILSKIELPDRVGAPIQQEEEKE